VAGSRAVRSVADGASVLRAQTSYQTVQIQRTTRRGQEHSGWQTESAIGLLAPSRHVPLLLRMLSSFPHLAEVYYIKAVYD